MTTLKKLVASEKTDLSQPEWSKVVVEKLATILNVAETSLEVIKDYAAERYSAAEWKLIVQLVLLLAAGAMTAAVMLLISRRVTDPLRSVQDGMLKIAAGNFNVTLPRIDRKDEVGMIVTAVNRMVEQVRSAIAEIKASSREVTNASAEIATSTTDLSQRTEEQAASLEETSAAMEEISTTVRRNAESAQEATKSASATRAVAGRGFAVVASEVRSLAQRSSQAAKDIAELITTSGSQVQEGVGLVNQAGEALREIVESIRSVAAVVSDIATASAEQATGLDEITKALNQMDEATQQNSALVEENAATSQVLEQQAKVMDEQVSFFQVDDREAESAGMMHPASEVRTVARPAVRRYLAA